MQTNQPTADQFVSNANATNAATENNAATTVKSYTDNLVSGKTKVPMPILVICILGLGGVVLSAIGLLISWQLIAAASTLILVYSVVALAANLLSIVWMLKMKKIGAYLYAAVFVAGQILLMAFGAWTVGIAFIIGAAVTGVALYYSKQMKLPHS